MFVFSQSLLQVLVGSLNDWLNFIIQGSTYRIRMRTTRGVHLPRCSILQQKQRTHPLMQKQLKRLTQDKKVVINQQDLTLVPNKQSLALLVIIAIQLGTV